MNRSLGGVARCETLEDKLHLTAPEVSNFQFVHDQRPQQLIVTLNQPVTVNSSLLKVDNLDTDIPEPFRFDGVSGNVLTLSFPDAQDWGILVNGNYELQIPASAVTSGSGETLAGTYYGAFWFLNGDVDRSRAVDATDYAIVDNGFVNHLSGWANGDLDINGTIDATDYAIIDNSFITQLPNVTDFYVRALTLDEDPNIGTRLSWTDNASGESYWRIDRAVGGGGFEFRATLPAGSTSFDDTNRADGTWYTYRVKAVNSSGDPIVTSAKRGAYTVLPMPTGVSAAGVPTGGIEVTWTDPTSTETAYSIERWDGVSGHDYEEVGAAFANETSWIDYSVSPGQTFIYRVVAVNADTRSAPSTPTSPTTAPTPEAPQPFANLTPELTARRTALNAIRLEWTDKIAGEVGFKVYRRLGESGTWSLVTQRGPNRTEWNDYGLPTGTIASYYVYGFGPFGQTPPSNVVTVRSPIEVHAVAATSTSIDVSWTFPWTDPAKFYIDAIDRARYLKYGQYTPSVSIAGFQRVAELPGSARSHRVSGLVDGETYFFVVIAQETDGTTGFNQTTETMTEPAPAIAPLPPENLQIQRFNYMGFNLTWEDHSAGNAGYVIRTRRDSEPFGSGIYIAEGNLTQYSLNLSGSTQESRTYEIEVRAYSFGDGVGGLRESDPIRQTVVVPTLSSPFPDVEWVSITPGSPTEWGSSSFTVSGGSIDNPVTVDLLLFGSATYGVDYTIPTSLTMTLSGSPIEVPVTGVADYLLEGDETITVVALASASHWGAIATMALGDAGQILSAKPKELTFGATNPAMFNQIIQDGHILADGSPDPAFVFGGPNLPGPHWLDANGDGDASDPGDHRYPLAYTRSGTWAGDVRPTVQVKLVGNFPAGNYLVRGHTLLPGNLDFADAPAVLQAGVLTANLTASALPQTIDKFPLTIGWDISLDGGKTWTATEFTVNWTYVSNIDLTRPVVETVLDIGCRNASGLTLADNVLPVLPAIWKDFTDRKVLTSDGRKMRYWGPISSGPDQNAFFTYARLITNADGHCESWAQLWIAVLAVQGISVTYTGIVPNFSTAPATGPNTGLGPSVLPDGTRGGGFIVSTTKGQGNDSAPTAFRNHAVVRLGGYILDPSYGRFSSFGQTGSAEWTWENQSVANLVYDYGLYDAQGLPQEQYKPPNDRRRKECQFVDGGFSYTP